MSKIEKKRNVVVLFKDRKYKEEDFLFPAADTKGHSERVWFRTQPGELRRLNTIMSSKRFPFKTSGDVMRLGLHLLLDALENMEAIPSVGAQVDTIAQIVREEAYHTEFQTTFESIRNTVKRMEEQGDRDEIRRMLREIKGRIDDMPEGRWRKMYSRTMEKEFGAYTNNAKLVGKKQDDDE